MTSEKEKEQAGETSRGQQGRRQKTPRQRRCAAAWRRRGGACARAVRVEIRAPRHVAQPSVPILLECTSKLCRWISHSFDPSSGNFDRMEGSPATFCGASGGVGSQPAAATPPPRTVTAAAPADPPLGHWSPAARSVDARPRHETRLAARQRPPVARARGSGGGGAAAAARPRRQTAATAATAPRPPSSCPSTHPHYTPPAPCAAAAAADNPAASRRPSPPPPPPRCAPPAHDGAASARSTPSATPRPPPPPPLPPPAPLSPPSPPRRCPFGRSLPPRPRLGTPRVGGGGGRVVGTRRSCRAVRAPTAAAGRFPALHPPSPPLIRGAHVWRAGAPHCHLVSSPPPRRLLPHPPAGPEAHADHPPAPPLPLTVIPSPA